jgi:hypothetical protein
MWIIFGRFSSFLSPSIPLWALVYETRYSGAVSRTTEPSIINMKTKKKMSEKSALLIPGFSTLGVGAGFFFFPQSVFGTPSLFAFIGCIMGGFAIGLIVSAFTIKDSAGEE